jgi:hypothetical protein
LLEPEAIPQRIDQQSETFELLADTFIHLERDAVLPDAPRC